MNNVRFSGLIFLGPFLILSILCGCEEKEIDEWPATQEIQVEMTNSTDEYTHMWTNGETMNEGNKIVPWISRYKYTTLSYEGPLSIPNLFVAVGRNGQELTRTSMPAPMNYKNEIPVLKVVATFNTSGVLTLKKNWGY
jgi:hypothetical protein